MRAILTQPDPRLRQKSSDVTSFDSTLIELCDELEAAMAAGPGGVGIAAPQIGELKRVVIVDCTRAMRPCKNHGLLTMINPEIVERDGEALGREGCLSVPDWVGVVPRAKSVRVLYQDRQGERLSLETSGFEARVIQHEIDHLDGILAIDRAVSREAFATRAEYERTGRP